MTDISRRQFMQSAIASSACLAVTSTLLADETATTTTAATRAVERVDSVWLDTIPSAEGGAVGVTWGVPWQRGTVSAKQTLRVEAGGEGIPAQAWPTAYWPDGSVKWSAVALAPGARTRDSVSVGPGDPVQPATPIRVQASGDDVQIDTGLIRVAFAKSGDTIFQSMHRGDRLTAKNGRLVAVRQDGDGDATTIHREFFSSQVQSATVEQSGPVRAVVKLTGMHSNGTRQWLPFVVRFYFYAGSDVVRIVHSFIWDGDEKKDFLSGLGVQFEVPMDDELHNRHVRLVGQDHGLFAEAVRPITGLRRDPGAGARQAQIDGKATSAAEWAKTVSDTVERIPAWGDFRLTQLSANGFQIRKRTKAGCGWIPAGTGDRAGGSGYLGGASGGVSFGVRDFWQKHPGEIDLGNAHTATANVTLWLYSPDAPPLDMRSYHDVMGMDTYDKQNQGLAITYEDYEPGYDTPYGIARTSEIVIKVEATTPSREASVAFADMVGEPPQLMVKPESILQAGVFGAQWTLPDRSTEPKAQIEDKLAQTLDQYVKKIDQRSWYGFWDYGDVMHSYDTDRHVWRYDIGGFAWDNSELSTDLWLWFSVLRTARADLYRMAEAMARHTGEVDVYHIGRFKGLGTRHGVQHWSDSSKQSRISTPIYRRIFYYLTADERTGDLLEEQMHTTETEKKIVVGRKLKPNSPTLPLPPVEDPPIGGEGGFGGMNWGNALTAWVTHAERTNDPAWHKKIVTAMAGVGRLPHGFYTEGWAMNVDTGEVFDRSKGKVGVSHLMACFGLPEIANELVSLYGDQSPEFAAAWAQFGRLYGGTNDQRQQELGPDLDTGIFKEASLQDSHSRCTAFAARFAKDPKLAQRAWDELHGSNRKKSTPITRPSTQPSVHLVGPAVLTPIDEIPMGTNGAAQWGLAAIECLALIGSTLK